MGDCPMVGGFGDKPLTQLSDDSKDATGPVDRGESRVWPVAEKSPQQKEREFCADSLWARHDG